MTNNEVIIDGVDVSECRFYQNTGFCLILDNCLWCHDEKQEDCYYKELQRKTQECEKMKEEAIYGYVGDLSNKLRAKVFKDLKEENQKYKSALDEIEEFCLVYRDNPVEGSDYKKILDIITKEKEQE